MFLDSIFTTPLSLIAIITTVAVPNVSIPDTAAELSTTQTRIETVIQAEPDTEVQRLVISSDVKPAELHRDGYSVEYTPPPPPVEEKKDTTTTNYTAPNVTPDPGSAQDEAWSQVQAYGWGQEEFNCLVALWNRESGWRVNALNSGSGAYGIPQSLPGNKMASAGGDWETNPATQIRWGLGYISGRYGTPCGAWGHSNSTGWY